MEEKNRYQVWSPTLGQSVDDAEEVFAHSQWEAAEQWARKIDAEDGVYDTWVNLDVHVQWDGHKCMRKTYIIRRTIEKFYNVVEDWRKR